MYNHIIQTERQAEMCKLYELIVCPLNYCDCTNLYLYYGACVLFSYVYCAVLSKINFSLFLLADCINCHLFGLVGGSILVRPLLVVWPKAIN